MSDPKWRVRVRKGSNGPAKFEPSTHATRELADTEAKRWPKFAEWGEVHYFQSGASGRSRSHAERAAAGRRNVMVTLTDETIDAIERVGEIRQSPSRSALITDLVTEEAERLAKKSTSHTKK